MFRLVPLAGLLLATAAAAGPAQLTYESRAVCEQANRLTSIQCGFAFLNARAEFEEKAPRYRARHDCQRAHKLCSAQLVGFSGFADASKAAAIYVPSFRGVTVALDEAGRPASVAPSVAGGGARFKARGVDAPDGKVDGRVAVVPDSRARRGRDPKSSGPFVRRGDRDDTIKVKLEVRDPNDANAVGLFVDKNGMEWYRPARRR